MDSIVIVFQAFIICIIIGNGLKFYIALRRDIKKVSENINSKTLQTDDMEIFSYTYRNVLVGFGSEFNYCKFYFYNDEVYFVGRNNFPQNLYSIPFILKCKNESDYSYFSKYVITELEILGNEMKIEFKHKKIIGTKFSLFIKNASANDLQLLKGHLS
ncbi:hypothetical protein [Flavobacterium sp. UMI-01]|uniref:hypothetical protein n=1 Tax=Flavobacterium sp. UMI-01 TaxID=1441053 RepID=UPI001C7D187E|nr:hypothetical protein [Flavobacterium sp. UMI-01]